MANAANWFEIPANNIKEAKTFYEKVFEVELTIMEMGPSLMAMFPYEPGAAGCSGALIQSEGYAPSKEGAGSVVYLNSNDIDASLLRVEKNGGKVLLPKTSIGENGTIAQFLDNQGNRVALHTPPNRG